MKDFNPVAYRISVQFKEVDGESYFVGEVSEFPDVEVFEDSADAAYRAIVDIIGSLREQYTQLNRPFPTPINEEKIEYSGRVTLRLPKSLHRSLDEKAQSEGVSLNTHLVCALSRDVYINTIELPSIQPAKVAVHRLRGVRLVQGKDIKVIEQKSQLVEIGKDSQAIDRNYSYTTEFEYASNVAH